MKASFSEMERMGICSKTSSPWDSPLHMVSKSDGSWHPCGDYQRINATDIINSIGSARVFTKLDLFKGYFHVPAHPVDVYKTVIITPFGRYMCSITLRSVSRTAEPHSSA